MGQNNRARRAAKQRQRATKQRARDPQTGFAPNAAEREGFAAGAAALMLGQLLRALIGGGPADFERADLARCAERHQQAALDEQFGFAVDRLIEGGWTPLDLYEVVRRKTASAAVTHLLDIVAEATARHPARLVHPQWLAQLDQLGAAAPRVRVSPSGDWGQRSGLEWSAACEQLVTVLVVICALPIVERVMPAPGSSSQAAFSAADGLDSKMLRRVRGLLAKAESTEHVEEADAFTAKAQELMTRYSIERAVAESAEPAAHVPVSRRLWPESPYVDAKALLIGTVAEANNCRAIQSSAWGYVGVVGHPGDLDVVELLVTSLLVQATRAMTLAGPQVTRFGASRTRSFRQSFLVAYAGRIGERLRESAQTTETGYDVAHGGVLLPVLRARREAVDDRVGELFPDMVERQLTVSNAAGWGAGRAAADLALFDQREAVGTGSPV